MIKIVIYHEPLRHSIERSEKRRKKKNPEAFESSIFRSQTTVKDLCICNNFDLFCTFTFNPKWVDGKNLIRCRRILTDWLHNSKKRHSPELEYLVIPELHKSGAIHFHALFKNYRGDMIDSCHITKNHNIIYNLKNWRFGFSTACKIDNIEAVSNYVAKYITKDMVLLPGKKRYFCSQGLTRPQKITNFQYAIKFVKQFPSIFTVDDLAEYYTILKKRY